MKQNIKNTLRHMEAAQKSISLALRELALTPEGGDNTANRQLLKAIARVEVAHEGAEQVTKRLQKMLEDPNV